MADDLPTGYYLDNFLTILDFVDMRYEHLLNAEERGFSRSFRSVSLDAQRLYVRLAFRKGPLFRSDKLTYPEIRDIPTAAHELAKYQLLETDGDMLPGASNWK